MKVDQVSSLVGASVAVLALFVTIVAFVRSNRGSFRLGNLLKVDFEREAQSIRDSLPPSDADPEDKQYALQREYHSRSLAQSRQSFWFSLMSASVGFLVIIGAIVVAAFDTSQSLQLPSLQILAGTVIEAVSALFFVQSNKARELMTQFFDKLREDRKFEESLSLAGAIDDAVTKDRLRTVLALAFSGSVDKDSYSHIFGSVLTSDVTSPTPDDGSDSSRKTQPSA